MDFNKMMQQGQEMQAQMQQAQEELKNETVEATAGGGMVKVVATGGGEIKQITIDPKAIDPDDPGMPAGRGVADASAGRGATPRLAARAPGVSLPRVRAPLGPRRGAPRGAGWRRSSDPRWAACTASACRACGR